MKKGEQSERSWSPLHLILMSVLWLSSFRRTQLLWWSDWMTDITCLESPTRQLIDNAWHKNVFVYPQIWLWAGFQFLVFFFINLIRWTEVDWGESHGSGGLVWESTAASGSIPYLSRPGVTHTIFIPFGPCCPKGDITWKHNLTPQFHSFSSIRLDWNFPAHFPGAVKWAVSHVSEPAPAHLL